MLVFHGGSFLHYRKLRPLHRVHIAASVVVILLGLAVFVESVVCQCGVGGLGAGDEGERIADSLTRHPELTYLFIGFLDEDFSNPRTLGKLDDIREIIQLKSLNCLIFTSTSSPRLMSIMNATQDLNIDYKIVPENLNMIYGKTSIETLDKGISMVEMEYKLHKGWNKSIKRSFDIVLSTLMLVIFSLPALFIKLVRNVKLNSENEKNIKWVWWEHPEKGRISLWWYPLLFGIFKGNLSFVGDVWKIPEGSKRIFKPGFCGLIQMEKETELQSQDHIRYMTFYMRNYSFSMDIEILLKTLFNLQ